MKFGLSVGRLARGTIAASILTFCVASGSGGDDPPNLLANGDFNSGAQGWLPGSGEKRVEFDWSRDGGRGGGGALHLRVARGVEGGPWIWWGWIENPPKDSALKISGWIRGDVKEKAAICVQAWSEGAKSQVAFATTPQDPPLRGVFDWTRVETVLPATPSMERLAVLAFVSGDGEAWFDDLRVERTNEAPAGMPAARPGLVMTRGEFELAAFADVVTPRMLIPMPASYREQVPLTYDLHCDPADALARTVVREDRPGNWVVDATFRPMKPRQTVRLAWRSLVLCGERSFAEVPKKAAIPAAWPEETRRWLRPTTCVQSDAPRIVAIAKELRAGTDDAMEVVRRVLKRAGDIFRDAKGDMNELTAVDALDRKGSCTSCANLVAALLRACGVPARVLAGTPLWSGPLQTHYIVEAFVPGYGWYPLESTMLKEAWQPYQQVEVAVIPPEYEERSHKRPGAMGGVPYLSLDERVNTGWWDVGTVDRAKNCGHVAELWRPLPTMDAAADWSTALGAARTRWSAWLAKAKLDGKNRLATDLQPAAVTATTAAELARQLAR